MKTALVLSATVLIATIYVAAQERYFDGKSLWRHVEVLAADDMEGRAASALPASSAGKRTSSIN